MVLRAFGRRAGSALGRRLLIAIVAFSSLVTLLLTAHQLYAEYRSDVASIEARLDEIRITQLGAIGNQLWELNDEILGQTLAGLVKIPEIHFLQVLSDDGYVQSVGERPAAEAIERRYPIQYTVRGAPLQIGTLRIIGTLRPARERLVARIGTTLVNNALKTFLVTVFALVLIHVLVVRRLGAISRFCRGYAPEGCTSAPLPTSRSHRRDELDDVCEALQVMLERVESGYAELRASEGRYRRILETAEEGVWMLDGRGVTTFANRRLGEILGHDPQTLVGRTVFEYMAAEWAEAARDMLQGPHTGKVEQREFQLLRSDGQSIWVLLGASAILTEEGACAGALAMVTDIELRKQAEADATRLAYFDPLTGLPNRGFVVQRLAEALSRSARHGRFGALLFLDLDNFKTINDSSGHFVGDAVLEEIAQRLRTTLRDEDTVSRFGGDEFVILLAELHANRDTATGQCNTVAQKLIDGISEPVRLETRELQVSASIGIAVYDGSESAEDVLRNADTALYRAKESGRGVMAFYRSEMRDAAVNRLTLEKGLRDALANGGIEVVYQPIVSAADGRVVGMEALSRWTDAGRGPIPPDVFVRIAEDIGIVDRIGAHCLQTACRDLAPLLRDDSHGLEHGLSVNISPQELLDPALASRVADVLQDTGIPPCRLQLEITEGSVLHETREATDNMKAIRDLGVGFAVDDFGTGYSSLRYLKTLPLRTLKIDRSFVHDLTIDPDDAAIVETILAIARHFGLDVIAEGVETAEHLDALHARGCRAFQGYYFARPMPIEDLLPRLRRGATDTPGDRAGRTEPT